MNEKIKKSLFTMLSIIISFIFLMIVNFVFFMVAFKVEGKEIQSPTGWAWDMSAIPTFILISIFWTYFFFANKNTKKLFFRIITLWGISIVSICLFYGVYRGFECFK